MNLKWKFGKFNTLNLDELYSIMAARQEVFVVEQNLNYIDADDIDQPSWHCCGWDGKNLAAYLRVLPPDLKYPEPTIGRVLTTGKYRGKSVGIQLMEKALFFIEKELGTPHVSMAAQEYLTKFYQKFGFEVVSSPFLDEGIQHVHMRK